MPVYTPATSGRQLQDVLQSIGAPGQRWDMVVVKMVVDAVIHDAPAVRDALQLWGTAGSVNGKGKRFPFPAVVLLSFTDVKLSKLIPHKCDRRSYTGMIVRSLYF